MLNKNKLSLVLALAVGATAAGRAAAQPDADRYRRPDAARDRLRDHDRDRDRDRDRARDRDRDGDGTWVQLGDVGTHVHDEEDYITPPTGARVDALQLRARDGAVAVDAVRIKYTDGRDQRIDVHRRLQPGETFSIDVPATSAAIKTLIVDYGNHGPFWRARETAHLTVLGLVDRDDDDARNPRTRGERYRDRDDRTRADDRTRDDRTHYDDRTRDDRTRYDDRTRDDDRAPDQRRPQHAPYRGPQPADPYTAPAPVRRSP